MNFLSQLFTNDIFQSAFYAWLIAQVLKVFTFYLTHQEFDLFRLIGSGGMPSSHSALVMGLSTAIGLKHGWDSSIYSLALVFSLIVMYDASGVRRAVGKQAIILNRMIKNYYQKKNIENVKLKELVGHTPVEVFFGAALGIVMAHVII
jgi:acid phosphatase family membrane protein YuiD